MNEKLNASSSSLSKFVEHNSKTFTDHTCTQRERKRERERKLLTSGRKVLSPGKKDRSFRGLSDGKESACNAGDPGLMPR